MQPEELEQGERNRDGIEQRKFQFQTERTFHKLFWIYESPFVVKFASLSRIISPVETSNVDGKMTNCLDINSRSRKNAFETNFPSIDILSTMLKKEYLDWSICLGENLRT